MIAGNEAIVSLLIQNGANVNAQDPLGESALSVAAYKGHLEVVNTLLKSGANVNHEVNL